MWRLGFGRQDGRAGQRADGRAHHAASRFHARHRALTPKRLAELDGISLRVRAERGVRTVKVG
jgi:hypothetical protein